MYVKITCDCMVYVLWSIAPLWNWTHYLPMLFIRILIVPTMAIIKSKVTSKFFQHFNTYSSLLKFSLFFIYDRDWYFKFPIRWTMKHLFSNKHMWALLLMLWWGRYLRSMSDPQLRKHDFLAWMNSHFSFFTKPQFVQMIRC